MVCIRERGRGEGREVELCRGMTLLIPTTEPLLEHDPWRFLLWGVQPADESWHHLNYLCASQLIVPYHKEQLTVFTRSSSLPVVHVPVHNREIFHHQADALNSLVMVIN